VNARYNKAVQIAEGIIQGKHAIALKELSIICRLLKALSSIGYRRSPLKKSRDGVRYSSVPHASRSPPFAGMSSLKTRSDIIPSILPSPVSRASQETSESILSTSQKNALELALNLLLNGLRFFLRLYT